MAAILTLFNRADFWYFRFGGCQEIGLYFREKKSAWSTPVPNSILQSGSILTCCGTSWNWSYISIVYSIAFLGVKLAFKSISWIKYGIIMRVRRYMRIHEGRPLPGLFLEHLQSIYLPRPIHYPQYINKLIIKHMSGSNILIYPSCSLHVDLACINVICKR